jgi:hypothetical protein
MIYYINVRYQLDLYRHILFKQQSIRITKLYISFVYQYLKKIMENVPIVDLSIHYPSCTDSIKPSLQFLCYFVVINASEGSLCFQNFNIDSLWLPSFFLRKTVTLSCSLAVCNGAYYPHAEIFYENLYESTVFCKKKTLFFQQLKSIDNSIYSNKFLQLKEGRLFSQKSE